MSEYTVTFSGSAVMHAMVFFDDYPGNLHEDATAADCAEQVRIYIENHGVSGFLREWSLEGDLIVNVDAEVAHP